MNNWYSTSVIGTNNTESTKSIELKFDLPTPVETIKQSNTIILNQSSQNSELDKLLQIMKGSELLKQSLLIPPKPEPPKSTPELIKSSEIIKQPILIKPKPEPLKTTPAPEIRKHHELSPSSRKYLEHPDLVKRPELLQRLEKLNENTSYSTIPAHTRLPFPPQSTNNYSNLSYLGININSTPPVIYNTVPNNPVIIKQFYTNPSYTYPSKPFAVVNTPTVVNKITSPSTTESNIRRLSTNTPPSVPPTKSIIIVEDDNTLFPAVTALPLPTPTLQPDRILELLQQNSTPAHNLFFG